MNYETDWKRCKGDFDSAFSNLEDHAGEIEAELKKYKGKDDKIGLMLMKTFDCNKLAAGDSQKKIKKNLEKIKKFNRKKSQGVSTGLRNVAKAMNELQASVKTKPINIDDYAKKRKAVQKALDTWQKSLSESIDPIVKGLKIESKSIDDSYVSSVNKEVSRIKSVLLHIIDDISSRDTILKGVLAGYYKDKGALSKISYSLPEWTPKG